MAPKPKKAATRPLKKGKTSASSSRPVEDEPSSPPSPPPPSTRLKHDSHILNNLQNKSIVVERRAVVNQILQNGYNLNEVVSRVGWEGILTWGMNAYPSIVKLMYASISKTWVDDNSCSFTISFLDRDEVVTPEKIGSIMGIPCSQNAITFVTDSPSESEKTQATRDICGFDCQWDNKKHHLTLNSLIPLYRIIHQLFTYNVYPRGGNRTELTPYMVNLLSKVVTRTPICLPSIICHTIIKFHNNPTQKNAIPFGFLMTQLALSFGLQVPHGENPISKAPFSITNLKQMNLLPNAQIPIVDEPPLAQEVPVSPSPARRASSSSMPSPRGPSSSTSQDRMAALEQELAYIKKKQKKQSRTMGKIFTYLSVISKSCRRDDVAAPPSPSPPSPDSD